VPRTKRSVGAFELPPEIQAKVGPAPVSPARAAPPRVAAKARPAAPVPRVTPARVAKGVMLEVTSEDATDLLGCVLEGRDAAAADVLRFREQGQVQRSDLAQAKHARLSKLLAALSQVLIAQWEGRNE
jgi:hypothetical protein